VQKNLQLLKKHKRNRRRQSCVNKWEYETPWVRQLALLEKRKKKKIALFYVWCIEAIILHFFGVCV
jgi:hypothetical protein